MARIALYAGSFDPVTNGHLDVMRQAARLAEQLVCAVGVHPGKAPLFSAQERVAMLEETAGEVLRKAGCALKCITFDDLVVTAAHRVGATLLIRGLRDDTDFNYEMSMAGMKAAMGPDVQTVFFPASSAVRPITATFGRQIGIMGGENALFVTQPVVFR